MESPCHKGTELISVHAPTGLCHACGNVGPGKHLYDKCKACGKQYNKAESAAPPPPRVRMSAPVPVSEPVVISEDAGETQEHERNDGPG